MKRYSSSMDGLAKTVPVLVAGLVAASLGVSLWAARDESTLIIVCTSILPLVTLIVILGGTWKARIKCITLDDNAITIERSLWPATIMLADIKSIRKVDDMMFALRTFGNGGMFGYTGSFYKKSIGRMQWFCSQRKNYVLMETTSGKKIVITPDEREEFMKDVEKKAPYVVLGGEIDT